MQKKIKNISRIPINGMLIAVYIVLSLPMLTVNIGGREVQDDRRKNADNHTGGPNTHP